MAATPQSSTRSEGPFSVERRPHGDGIILTLRGELDLATVAVAEDELRRAEQSHALIALDLRELIFMDSTGLHLVVSAEQRARERGGQLAIVQGSQQVKRLFDLTGAGDQLYVVSDPSELWDGAR